MVDRVSYNFSTTELLKPLMHLEVTENADLLLQFMTKNAIWAVYLKIYNNDTQILNVRRHDLGR